MGEFCFGPGFHDNCFGGFGFGQKMQQGNFFVDGSQHIRTERAIENAVIQRQARPGLFELPRRNAFYGHKQVVEPPCTRQARVVGGCREGRTGAELVFGVFEGKVLAEFLGANTRPFREEPLKVELAHIGLIGQIGQRRLVSKAGCQVFNGTGNLIVGVGVVRVHGCWRI